ncbi:MAG: Lrp/AsnC family transcriptional regulator [Firmicutes bacterium]|nr:Lrp/AsnC family transcriptional regulator [Bacillota bacterium]MBQ6295377.1 Lrp/AsnC family transcriptional regulator [Bacillota bacterium]MBR0050678.1 Lrp/AsnC family transcriptional regulator [Bacillota bacterium]MBR0209206.1 Lrp/AsnC family transcriptional regulator [Bacillota bacterium]MBR0516845.1 Lrp/AsnC family transcriptional regulator [Bacillota bacterium]
MALDTIDVRILEVLQENARVSISELSKQVNLSLSAVSERLKKLENSNIIEQYTTVLNPAAMEKELSAIMMISMEDPSDTVEFRRLVQELDEILECHYITGTYDYVLKITTKNMATLELLMNKIKSIKSIKHTETNVIFSTIKNKHSVVPIATKL